MIRHLLKVVWHRKRSNALVMAEIFLSFLVVFAVTTLAVSLASRWRAPLGFSPRDVWVIDVNAPPPQEHSSTHATPPGDDSAEVARGSARSQQFDRIARSIATLPQIAAVAVDAMPPYANASWNSIVDAFGKNVQVTRDTAGDGFADVLHLNLLRGRWFTREDEGQTYVPTVLDADAAHAIFDATDVVGKTFESFDGVPGHRGRSQFKVVGVIAPYRQSGEFSTPKVNMVFTRASAIQPWSIDIARILIRVRPGTPGNFETELSRQLHAFEPGATFQIRRMEQMRSSVIRESMLPVTALGIVALFLISMVALGLTGVLWQNVTSRMREIGVRRALGASGTAVRGQILVEVALLTTLAVAIGVVIILQLPLLGVGRILTATEFAVGLSTALLVIYGITLLCGAYPGWMASTIEPAEALRYE